MRTVARLAMAAAIGLTALLLGVRPVEAESFSYNVSPAHGPASAPFVAWITDTGSRTACNDGWWGYFYIDQPGATILEYDFDAPFTLKLLVTGFTLCKSVISQSEFPSAMTGPWVISMIVTPAAGAKSQEAAGDATYMVDVPPTPTAAPTPTPTTPSTPTSVVTPHTTSSPARTRATATPSSSTRPSTQPAATSTASHAVGPVASTGGGSGGVPGWLFAALAVLVVVGASAYYFGAREPAPRPPPPG